MGMEQEWVDFADQRISGIRETYLQGRIQVCPEDSFRFSPEAARMSWLTERQAIDAEWFRSLSFDEKMVVRGAALNSERRKAVLIGRWAAAQFGMWFTRPRSFEVQLALPSGHMPPKETWPQLAEYRAMKINSDDVVDLGGVRATHPLRTLIDYCRMDDSVNAMLTVAWLLQRGIAREDILRYLDTFDSPVRRERLESARRLAERTPLLSSMGYNMAYALLRGAGVPLRTNCTIEEMAGATLIAGEDLIIEVGENPLRQPAETRRRKRWLAARGYRCLSFAEDDIVSNPEAFVDEVLGCRHLRLRGLGF